MFDLNFFENALELNIGVIKKNDNFYSEMFQKGCKMLSCYEQISGI